MIDNRVNDGISDEMIAKMMGADMPIGCGRGMFEAPTVTCSHCQVIVVLNPNRQRERPHCRKCDHYICDKCGIALALTGICKPFKQVIDEVLEQAEKQQIILPT